MKRLMHLFRQTEFHVLVSLLGLVLFCWPLMDGSGSGGWRADLGIGFLLGAWLFMILLLFLISRALATENNGEKES